jgi:hypothetical protein
MIALRRLKKRAERRRDDTRRGNKGIARGGKKEKKGKKQGEKQRTKMMERARAAWYRRYAGEKRVITTENNRLSLIAARRMTMAKRKARQGTRELR